MKRWRWRRDRRTLVRRRTSPHPRRNPRRTEPRRPRPRRSRLPCGHRCRTAAKSPQLRAARRAVPGKTLSIHGPPDRRPRRARAGAGGVCADAGISADRGGEGAAGGLMQAGEVKTQASRRQRLTQCHWPAAMRSSRRTAPASMVSPASSSRVAIRYVRFTSIRDIRMLATNVLFGRRSSQLSPLAKAPASLPRPSGRRR